MSLLKRIEQGGHLLVVSHPPGLVPREEAEVEGRDPVCRPYNRVGSMLPLHRLRPAHILI